MKNGLLVHRTKNIGDEIQSLAASQFLPVIDYLVDRESINKQISNEKVFIIMNAWWMHKSNNFPPFNYLKPKFVSVHFNKKMKQKILEKNSFEYLKSHEPIGCRDQDTMNFLLKNNIKAYFSGCLTLTLKKDENIRKLNDIVIVDAPENISKIVKDKTNRNIIELTHNIASFYSPKAKLYIAKRYLNLYQRAHLVITSRLHVALPCLAFETPVIFVNKKNEQERFSGLLELLNSVGLSDYELFLENYDYENPIQNSDDYKTIRDDLIIGLKKTTNYYNSINFNEEDILEEFNLYQSSENEIDIFSDNLFSFINFKSLIKLNSVFVKKIIIKFYSKFKLLIRKSS